MCEKSFILHLEIKGDIIIRRPIICLCILALNNEGHNCPTDSNAYRSLSILRAHVPCNVHLEDDMDFCLLSETDMEQNIL